jgi:soluble lytic murein transglycosylase-like protein
MVTMLTRTWSRYFDADRRQLPLFPEWERMRWLAPLPSLGAALALAVLFAVGTPWTPSDVIERTASLTEPAAERDEPAPPQYDLAAIPDHIKAAAQRHRLSEELIAAVISVESNFDHAAVSQKGARGLMQLMPATASLIGVQDPHDPDENIDAGASHLRAMLDSF